MKRDRGYYVVMPTSMCRKLIDLPIEVLVAQWDGTIWHICGYPTDLSENCFLVMSNVLDLYNI